MNAATQKNPVRTMLMRMLAGAVVGAAGMGLFLTFVAKPHLELGDPSNMIAIVAGVSYLLIGLSVAVGLVAPNAGARFLNVEDSDELREERPKLQPATAVFVLTGVFLLVLAMANSATGFLSPAISLTVAAVCMVGIIAAGWISSRHSDELTRQMGQEAASMTFQVAMLVLGGWAALAQFGYVGWMGPLALISTLAMLQLVVTFIVIGRRGMLIR